MIADVKEWFSALDGCGRDAFPKKERGQPVTPSRRIFE
jgi:hypothetical protein